MQTEPLSDQETVANFHGYYCFTEKAGGQCDDNQLKIVTNAKFHWLAGRLS
jgi:hypothetical protein